MKRKIKIFTLVIAIILLGYLRSYFFANINWIYLTLVNNRPNAALSEFHFLLEWTPLQINILKTFLTGFFSLLFMGMTLWIVQVLFENKAYNKLIIYTYLILMLTALVLFTLSLALGLESDFYGAVHSLMDIVQSFMPLMIFTVLFTFLNEAKTE